MRERFVDIALLVALIIVAAIIVWTLFGSSLFFSNRPAPKSATETPTNSSTSPPIVPLAPGQANSTPSSEAGTAPENSTANPETTAEATPQPDTTAPETPTSETPLPEGGFKLERVGFSFVTGGAGACNIKLEAWKHIAVSHDILAKYPCGSTVMIHLDKPVAGHETFQAVVADTMNPVHTKTVNIYVGQDEPALQYGVKSGDLEP